MWADEVSRRAVNVVRLRFTLTDRIRRCSDMGGWNDRLVNRWGGNDCGRRRGVVNHRKRAGDCRRWGDVGSFCLGGGWRSAVRSSDGTGVIRGVCPGVVTHVLPVVPFFAEEA
jgi:hypothetical protein